MEHHQVEMISLEELVPANHVYRKFLSLLNFKSIAYRLKRLENNANTGAKIQRCPRSNLLTPNRH